MAATVHELAPNDLPIYVPGPDGVDWLYIIAVLLVVLVPLGIGILFFTLHELPEKLAIRAGSTQVLLISVLAVLALFTSQTIFWFLALLLAVVRLPDITTPLNSIARSLAARGEREE